MSSCKNIIDGHFDHDNTTLGERLSYDGVSALRFFSGVMLFVILTRNRHRASKEDGMRAMLLVLPSYYPIIIAVIIYYFIFSILHVVVSGYHNYMLLLSMDVAVNHAMNEGLAFFLMQHGAGLYAFKRSTFCAFAFGLVAFCVYYFVFTNASNETDGATELSKKMYMTHVFFAALLLSLFAAGILLPSELVYRRPAFFAYAKFCFFENCFWVLSSSLVFCDVSAGYCTVLFGRILFNGFLHPFFFVYSLAKDSEFWQGCNNNPNNLHNPVHGAWDLNLKSASAIGTVMSEMHENSLPIIHFSTIEFSFRKYISGGLSRVYFGKCRKKEVAIKVLFAIELTPKIVNDFYEEVRVMYMLQHENVLQLLGISVMPPAVCMILEYCPCGSLYDFIYQSDNEPSNNVDDNATNTPEFVEHNIENSRGITHSVSSSAKTIDELELSGIKKAHLISSVRNPLSNDTKRGHRSMPRVRSYDKGPHHSSVSRKRSRSLIEQFLSGVDSLYRKSASSASVRHSDGRSSSVKKSIRKLSMLDKYKLMLGACKGVAYLHDKGYMHCDIKSPNFLIGENDVVKLADLGEARLIDEHYPSLPFPAYNWAPPELFNTDASKRFYTAASDVYGLAMVLSEILTQSLPLEDVFSASTDSEIYQHLLAGKRPELPFNIPVPLSNIIKQAWNTNADHRPSAKNLEIILEDIYLSELAKV